jgi:hypothetical protein
MSNQERPYHTDHDVVGPSGEYYYDKAAVDYPKRTYTINQELTDEQLWGKQHPLDVKYGYDPEEGLKEFMHFFASETSIPGPFRPRPVKQESPSPMNLTQQFKETQQLNYYNGEAPDLQPPFLDDPVLRDYIITADLAAGERVERCGCGASPLIWN